MKTLKKSLLTAFLTALVFTVNMNLHAQNKASTITYINRSFSADSGLVTKERIKNLFRRMVLYTDSLKLRGDTTRLAIKTTGTGVGIAGATGATDKLEVQGNLSLTQAGNKIKVATGSNASIGTATLVAGTVTVNTTAMGANSFLFYQRKTAGGTTGKYSYTQVNGTSFTINSDSNTDTSTLNWWIIN